MNPKERKSAECEVEFLRVITGPTIIKFTESFIENQNISDGGSEDGRRNKLLQQSLSTQRSQDSLGPGD